MSKIRRVLTDDEITRITDKTNGVAYEHRTAVALLETWHVILGHPIPEGLVPHDYAIPEEQSHALMTMMVFHMNGLDASNAMLTWVNIGPSSFRPEPASVR